MFGSFAFTLFGWYKTFIYRPYNGIHLRLISVKRDRNCFVIKPPQAASLLCLSFANHTEENKMKTGSMILYSRGLKFHFAISAKGDEREGEPRLAFLILIDPPFCLEMLWTICHMKWIQRRPAFNLQRSRNYLTELLRFCPEINGNQFIILSRKLASSALETTICINIR